MTVRPVWVWVRCTASRAVWCESRMTPLKTADALGTATGTLWGGVILVAHGLQLADSRIDRSPAHLQHSRHIRETAKADLQRLDRGVAASLLFRQRTQVDMKSSCD